MAQKIAVTNISSVGIIFRRDDPSQIFIEVKDDGHPIKLVRRQLCFIGGNWIGESAKLDVNPLATFRRELAEELSFDRPLRNSIELAKLGMADAETFAPALKAANTATMVSRRILTSVRRRMQRNAVPFGDFLNTVPKSALDAADPENKRDGFTTLASYWAVPLGTVAWSDLQSLQDIFGNLSNESVTLITSLDDIVKTNTKTSFCHDRVLQRFFLTFGYAAAKELPLVPGLESVPVGPPLATYADYLERYEVAKRPV